MQVPEKREHTQCIIVEHLIPIRDRKGGLRADIPEDSIILHAEFRVSGLLIWVMQPYDPEKKEKNPHVRQLHLVKTGEPFSVKSDFSPWRAQYVCPVHPVEGHLYHLFEFP